MKRNFWWEVLEAHFEGVVLVVVRIGKTKPANVQKETQLDYGDCACTCKGTAQSRRTFVPTLGHTSSVQLDPEQYVVPWGRRIWAMFESLKTWA